VDVTWSQAVAYTNWLTESTGAKYRLPTEAEWEYAARAGSTGLYPFGDTVSPAYARFDTGLRSISPLPNDDRTTRSNGYRLWHVAGNVREWTVDVWRERYDQEGDPGMRTISGTGRSSPLGGPVGRPGRLLRHQDRFPGGPGAGIGGQEDGFEGAEDSSNEAKVGYISS
jgi:formylglycine-generating enzyme required for sulfatase activity